MTQYGANTYTYTLKGELETRGGIDGVTTYQYDPMGNLSQAVLPNNTVIGYTYDAQGRLIAKRVNGVIEYRLIYSGQLAPIAKLDADGNILEEYVYGTGINSPDYIVKAGSVYLNLFADRSAFVGTHVYNIIDYTVVSDEIFDDSFSNTVSFIWGIVSGIYAG